MTTVNGGHLEKEAKEMADRASSTAEGYTSPLYVRTDMTSVHRLLDAVDDTLAKLHNKRILRDPDVGPSRRNDPERAELSRELLHAVALLRTAACELELTYYEVKNRPDPRYEK